MNRDLRHRSVIINLWADNDRINDYMSVSPRCAHFRQSKDHCLSCGGFVGWIGKESDPLLYFKHVELLANSFIHSDDVYIISDRVFPEDYELPSYGMNRGRFKDFRHKKVYTVYDTVLPHASSSGRKPKVRYVIHYTDSRDSFLNNPLIYHKSMDFIQLLAEDKDTLLVNPTKSDLKYYHSGFTFFLPNSSIMVLLKDSHVRDSIQLLR